MRRVLVVYGTAEGQTAKIATFVAGALRDQHLTVDVSHAGSRAPKPDDYDAVVVAASVHAGQYQRAVTRWVTAHAEVLNVMQTAFISVSLGVLERDADVHRQVKAVVNRFLEDAGWCPSRMISVAGALPYTRYGPFKRWLMKRIVATGGGDTDTSRDYEYTDWEGLRALALEFARGSSRIRALSPIPAHAAAG